MRRTVGVVFLVVGLLTLLSGWMMDTTVRIGGSPAAVVGTTYGTTVLPAVEARYVHNIGLMQDQQNRMMAGGVLAVVGAILLAGAKGGAAPSVSAEPQQLRVEAPRAEPTDARLAELGITQVDGQYLIGAQRFASAAAAVLFAESRR
jgi:hypothetical protein